MHKIAAIIQKELGVYFRSPLAYLFLTLLIGILNVFFFMIVDQSREATLKDIFMVMEFMFIFWVPILSMGSLALEKQMGTMEFLLTAPLTAWQIVVGKYLSLVILLSVLVAFTGTYYGILEFFAPIDHGAVITGYAGIWLEGAFFAAVGLLASSMTQSQVIAAISTYVILFMLYFLNALLVYIPVSIKPFIVPLVTSLHLENLASGVIAPGDIYYFISGIACCLFLTVRRLDERVVAK